VSTSLSLRRLLCSGLIQTLAIELCAVVAAMRRRLQDQLDEMKHGPPSTDKPSLNG
jgi:hypothetical protein